jgi:hypothetical protein
VTHGLGRLAAGVLCGCALLAVWACGKRGNPMPPLVRVPAAPTDLAVARYADDVFVRVTVPASNIDGVKPADVARVDVYAITLDRDPRVLAELTPEELRKLSSLVASQPVRRPPPPPPPQKEGAPPIPVPPPEPGVDQGAIVVVSEALTPEARAIAKLPDADEKPQVEAEEIDVPRPLVAPVATAGPQRFYYAVAVSRRERFGPHTGLQPAPLGPPSGSPSAPVIEVSETSATLRWTPPEDAKGQAPPTEPDLLPSRSLVPVPPPTTYEVYQAPSADAKDADAPPAMPTPLTPSPVTSAEWVLQNITLGAERCFYVRAVDTIDGQPVRGPASPTTCDAFTDTFVPSPPRDLLAASVPGAITLIWESSEAKDVAGYLVLRGEAGGDTLTPLNTTPTTELRYRDESVTSGVRYVYAVVAVDAAGNRSGESNRAEETAR